MIFGEDSENDDESVRHTKSASKISTDFVATRRFDSHRRTPGNTLSLHFWVVFREQEL